MENVLIATLGESPVVITAIYNMLIKEFQTTQEEFQINRLVVLHTQGKDELIPLALDLIREALPNECRMDTTLLSLEDAEGTIAKDADSVKATYAFLHTLYLLLDNAEKAGDSVYLSLAGGRKNMSALMAILVPLFPCVKKLYHLIDLDENSPHRSHFKTIEELVYCPVNERLAYFSPDLDRLRLVDIPYGERQHVSAELRTLLFTITEEQLDALWDQDQQQAQTIELYHRVSQKQAGTPALQIRLTESVKNEYIQMRRNQFRFRRFTTCFEQMKNPNRLRDKLHGSGFTRDSLSFHFYKRDDTGERPFFHTEPQSIHLLPEDPKARSKADLKIDTVIISGLALERDNGSYEPPGDILLSKFNPAEKTVPLEAILPAGASAEPEPLKETALIVPLGNRPMIATQLYTLLTYQGSNIRKVVLVYPANSEEINNGADLIQEAFEAEGKEVSCLPVKVQGYKDIDSRDACIAYERALEEVINAVSDDYHIELALSGGRKGMAALAMFVAQRKDIRYVYHTLITDKQLNDQVEQEATIKDLQSPVNELHRNDRLFLRAYEGDGPYTKFVLFKVPVLPTRGSSHQ